MLGKIAAIQRDGWLAFVFREQARSYRDCDSMQDFVVSGLAPSRASPLPQGFRVAEARCWARGFGAFGYAGQSRCWEISFEISTIDVRPVNSNFTLPSDEK